ncbi:hypothetical protein BH10PAT2_BH10PAT2_3750 [soil metagenome]
MASDQLPRIGRGRLIFIVLFVSIVTVFTVLIAQSTIRVANITPSPTRTATITRTPTDTRTPTLTPTANMATLIPIANMTRSAEGRPLLPTIVPLLNDADRLGTLNAPPTLTPTASDTPTPRPTFTRIPTQISQADRNATAVVNALGGTFEARNQVTPTQPSGCQIAQRATLNAEATVARLARATDIYTGQLAPAPTGFVPNTATPTSTACPPGQ